MLQKAAVDVGGDLARQPSGRVRLPSDLESSKFSPRQDSGLIDRVGGRVEEVLYRCYVGGPSSERLLNENC